MKFKLSEYQEKILNWVKNGKGNAIIEAYAGSGKCLKKGEEVIMYDGSFKKVEDIKQGELLMGTDSTPRKVLSLINGVGKLYKISPVKGNDFIVNEDHILTFKHTSNIPIYKNKIIDVKVKDILNGHDKIKLSNLNRYDKQWKLFRVPIEFDYKTPKFDPYLVGLWLGDGTTKSPTIHNPDKEIINYIEKYCKENNYICNNRYLQDTHCNKLSIVKNNQFQKNRITNPFRDYLKNNCLDENGDKKIPEEFIYNSKEVRLQLLAGLMDTDGTYDKRKNGAGIILKGYNMTKQLDYLIKSLGLYCSFNTKYVKLEDWKEARPYYRLELSGHLDMIPTLVKRKQGRKRLINKDVCRTGWDISYNGEGEYYGFMLDGDKRFLTKDFIVTHNSSTLVECANLIGDGDNLFVAFNKRIQLDLSDKLKHTTMKATTLHALGFSIIMGQIARGNKVEVDNKKVGNIINELDLDIDRDSFFIYINIIKAIKSFNIDYKNKQDLDDLFDYMNITTMDSNCYRNIEKIMNRNNSMIFKIDFEDMIYIPLQNKINKRPKDWIFCDELQDLNNAQFELLNLFIGNKTRLVAVGDKFQSIYGFRGALLTIMDDFKKKYNCTTFKLPITYRCPKSHIGLVKNHVPDIEAFEKNPKGIIKELDWNELHTTMENDSVYIARTNRYVVETVLHLLRNKRKATAYGKDIGKHIQTYIKSYKCYDKSKFVLKLRHKTYELYTNNKEYSQNIKIEQNMNKLYTYKKRIKQNEYEMDLIETIEVLLEECTTIKELDKLIETIFSDNIIGIICSTIHKIKGLEFDNVYVMQNKLPMIWSNQNENDIEQEFNLHYVAHTRSKHKIVLVTKEDKKK